MGQIFTPDYGESEDLDYLKEPFEDITDTGVVESDVKIIEQAMKNQSKIEPKTIKTNLIIDDEFWINILRIWAGIVVDFSWFLTGMIRRIFGLLCA